MANIVGTDNLASLPPDQSAIIGPGLPASPNYPAPGVFAGWVEITACQTGLIGWDDARNRGRRIPQGLR